jgi:P27 family predicted phage terminase small subunit
MGHRGPAPTPTAILQRRGSWHANRRSGEPILPAMPPPKPSELGPVAAQVWDTYEPILLHMGVLTEADGIAFQVLCETYEAWWNAYNFCRHHKVRKAVYDRSGQVVKYVTHPKLKERERMTEQLTRILREFGLTPSARTAIKVLPPQESNEPSIGRIT